MTRRATRNVDPCPWPFPEVASRIRSTRVARHMSQHDLATAIGVSRVSVVNMESGRHCPTLDGVYRVAWALGCSPHDLLPDEARDPELADSDGESVPVPGGYCDRPGGPCGADGRCERNGAFCEHFDPAGKGEGVGDNDGEGEGEGGEQGEGKDPFAD